MDKNKYNSKCDIFSLGLIIFEMVACKRLVNVAIGVDTTIPDYCEQDIKQLIMACWEQDPERRPSAELLLTMKVLHLLNLCLWPLFA